MAIMRVTALASLIVSFYFLIANLTLEERHGDSSKKHKMEEKNLMTTARGFAVEIGVAYEVAHCPNTHLKGRPKKKRLLVKKL
jgi:hypothetical protein